MSKFNFVGTFDNPEDFEQYIVRAESGGFSCTECFYTQNQKAVVRNHVEAKHFPNTFTYNCHLCDKVFGTKGAYSKHNQRYHKDKLVVTNVWYLLGQITCPEDFQKFIHRDQNGKYGCTLCSHNVSSLKDVKNHVESKHFPNTFSYSCPLCDKIFGTNSAYTTHKVRYHKWLFVFMNVYEKSIFRINSCFNPCQFKVR